MSNTEQISQQNKYVFFWGGVLSQWYKSNFHDNSMMEYNCAEQYMMAQKALLFKDEEAYAKIKKAKDPREQKLLGRNVKNFDANLWAKSCYQIVKDGNEFKFSQNDYLKRSLLLTQDLILVEASPYDKIWGIGMSVDDPDILDESKWKGTNLLGKALMEVRELLRQRLNNAGDNRK